MACGAAIAMAGLLAVMLANCAPMRLSVLLAITVFFRRSSSNHAPKKMTFSNRKRAIKTIMPFARTLAILSVLLTLVAIE